MKHSFADVNLRLGCTLRLYKSVNMELFGLSKSHPLIAAFEPQFLGRGRDIPFFTFRPDKLLLKNFLPTGFYIEPKFFA